MVVKLEKVLKTLTSDEKDELKSLENGIDNAITENFDGEAICMATDYVGKRVLKELKDKYHQAGRNLQYVDDWRDGDYLRISPRRKK